VLGLLVVLLLLLVLGGGGVIMWQWKRAEMMRREAIQMELLAREEAERAREEAEAAHAQAQARPKERPVEDILRDGRRQAAAPFLDRGLERCAKGEVNEGLLWFARGLEQSGDDAALQRVFRANLAGWGGTQADRKLCTQNGAVTALAVSPDGKVVLTGGEDGAARAWDAAGGPAAGEAPAGPGKVSALAFGAGGKQWLVARGDKVWRVPPTGKPEDEPTDPPGPVLAMSAQADGKVLMLGTCERGVWLAEDGDRGEASNPIKPNSLVLSAAFGPGGKVILTGDEDHAARLWDVRGRAVGKPLAHDAPVRAVAVTADGMLLATAAGKSVRFWDGATHLPVGRPLTHEAEVVSITFTSDGKSLLTGDQAGAVRRWPAARPLEGDVPRVRLWVEVMARKELDDAGAVRPINDKALMDRRQKLQELGGPLTP
jgi:WD40 repeat protein